MTTGDEEDKNNNKQHVATTNTNGGGVADYFAILGVGETLVWKHTQKKKKENESTEEQEDEAALLERFYREIMEISIVSERIDPPPQIPPQQQQQQAGDAANNDEESFVDGGNSSISNVPSSALMLSSSPNLNPSEVGEPTTSRCGGLTVLYHTCSASRHPGQQKPQVYEANLDPLHGLKFELMGGDDAASVASSSGASVVSGKKTPLKGLKQKLRNQISMLHHHKRRPSPKTCFFLGYRRRGPDESDKPAIADVSLRYVRIHKSTILSPSSTLLNARTGEPTTTATETTSRSSTLTRDLAKNVVQMAEAGKNRLLESYRSSPQQSEQHNHQENAVCVVLLEEMLTLPIGFDEWSIPEEYKVLRFGGNNNHNKKISSNRRSNVRRTMILSDHHSQTSEGVEAAYMESSYYATAPPPGSPRSWASSSAADDDATASTRASSSDHNPPRYGILPEFTPDSHVPKLLPETLPAFFRAEEEYVHVPVLAIRRQRLGDEERYHEDAAIVDVCVSFCDGRGRAAQPDVSEEEDMDHIMKDEEENAFSLLGKSPWCESDAKTIDGQPLGTPALLVRKNNPIGFADAAFATSVLDRFPMKNYKDFPLPEEELPMFCYPTGCRLHRAPYSDAPLPEYYGFVVKNERGDSIHVSCVSFMEPLTPAKAEQLKKMSIHRQRTSLPDRRYCEKRGLVTASHVARDAANGSVVSELPTESDHVERTSDFSRDDAEDSMLLTAFDEMTTFENKTICLISRYPFWTAFRRFLSHLHVISGSSSDLPLERFISHLLLSVPVPKAQGPTVVVPLPALNGPMLLYMPPAKDFPLLDLPFQRIFACLDVPTVVTIVLGFLALERKIIIMSCRPSLVLDACELLRSLLFPFELCAPYVPRLTQPFMSCLDFPGAIFVGIHDDGTPDGLASMVRKSPPEDSAIVDLDTGEIDCSGDRYEVLKQCWGIIPSGPRSMLISEVETLCRDAGIVPGQEPLDSQVDSAFAASLPAAFVDEFDTRSHNFREPLDDRAIRDAFLRFFCAVLGGYERYLVVPDADFLISGNEWFDAQGFLSVAPQERAPYLGSLVATQLFQSFIQRRTEASDVHCLLFDECLIEYHSSPVPYGRLGGDVETVATTESGQPQMLFSLLVDQCAAEQHHSVIEEPRAAIDRSIDEESTRLDQVFGEGEIPTSPAGQNSMLSFESTFTNSWKQSSDIVTTPSRHNLPDDSRFVYFVDGNPCFPHRLNADLFYPTEPGSLSAEISDTPSPLLARTEREREESHRRRKAATSHRGQTQRRCLWQLPKLMGSHFLGSWLMCIPSQVSQPGLSQEQQSRYLLRALGALRLLRSKQRIIPDEAAYRSLMVACGRIGSDRRIELVKLFGLLRSDGIFPSAVTLGQYTRALAEGYSKRSIGMTDDDHAGVEVTMSGSYDGRVGFSSNRGIDYEGLLNAFDGNLAILEDSGRRWRQRHSPGRDDGVRRRSQLGHGDKATSSEEHLKKPASKPWIPVFVSSSLVPSIHEIKKETSKQEQNQVKFVALWSRTRTCDSCSYIPLDEEIQSGWDMIGSEIDNDEAVCCPRCGSLFLPMIGFKEMSVNEAAIAPLPDRHSAVGLPAQLGFDVERAVVDDCISGKSGFVKYISPAVLRSCLERYVEMEGESVLDRESLRRRDPELFFNLWWYCARFSLPLPLPIVPEAKREDQESLMHTCAFAAWDKSVALRGCYEGARTLLSHSDSAIERGENLETETSPRMELPVFSRFSMQAFSQGDWDNGDLSDILVSLVDACDKRDFKPVIECVLRCNRRRREKDAVVPDAANISAIEPTLSDLTNNTATEDLDCYRTILYLAKYQCTTAFHVFFPAMAKPCKGYHFWCATGTPLPVFDHLFRDAVKRIRIRDKATYTPLHDVSDVALGFRCVFGHII